MPSHAPTSPDPGENAPRLLELTTAQHEVLRMMTQGYDNASIAEKRECRLSTVENLIGEIYRRLDIDPRGNLNPRVEAARRFMLEIGLPDRD